MNITTFAKTLTEMLPSDIIVEGGWDFKPFSNLRYEENPLNWSDSIDVYRGIQLYNSSNSSILITPELFINVEEYKNCFFYIDSMKHWSTKKPYRDLYFIGFGSSYFGYNYFTMPSSIEKDFELFEIYQEILTRAVLRVDTYSAPKLKLSEQPHRGLFEYKTAEFSDGKNLELICFLLEDVGFKMKRFTDGLKPQFFKKFNEDNPILNIEVTRKHKSCRIQSHFINICDRYIEFGKYNVFTRHFRNTDTSLRFRIPIPEKIENFELMSSLFKKFLKIVELT